MYNISSIIDVLLSTADNSTVLPNGSTVVLVLPFGTHFVPDGVITVAVEARRFHCLAFFGRVSTVAAPSAANVTITTFAAGGRVAISAAATAHHRGAEPALHGDDLVPGVQRARARQATEGDL